MEFLLLLALPVPAGFFSSDDSPEKEPETSERSDSLSADSAKQILDDLSENETNQTGVWWEGMVRSDGTDADDTITGDADNDLIFGGLGNDQLNLGEGENLSWSDPRSQPVLYDTFSEGDDTIVGGSGEEVV